MTGRDPGDAGGEPRRPLRMILALVAGVAAVLFVVGVVVTGIALQQIRSQRVEAREFVEPIPGRSSPDRRQLADGRVSPGRVRLEIAVAQLLVVPASAGEPIRFEADYDPREYVLEHAMENRSEGGWSCRVRFVPAQSRAMALLRVKLGASLPRLRLTLPKDVALILEGTVDGGFAAMELGGLRIESTELHVSGGAASISFGEPLARPMDRFTLIGDKGSLEVTGLGNASPREALLEQRFGELDLDLRGAWLRDANIRIDAKLAGGSLWLPDDVVVEGIDPREMLPLAPVAEELPSPRLRLSITERGGRMVIVN